MAFRRRTRIQFANVPRQAQGALTGNDVLAFVVGLGCSFSVHLIGQIQISDILLILLLPILLLLRARKAIRPGLKPVFILIGLWLFGQMMTDIYRETARVDWMRGNARIIVFAINLLSLVLLIGRNERRKVAFLAGFAISSLLAARFQPSDDKWSDPWKFGYADGTILLVVLVSSYFFMRGRYSIVGFLLLGIAGVNLIMNYRSAVLFILVTMVLVVPAVPERIGRLRLLPRAGSTARVAVLVALVLGAGGMALTLVDVATSAGLAGEDAQFKNEQQSRSALGTLLGGRPEILVSSRAVMDSPILGHGSWAKDWKYLEMLSDIETEYGIKTNLDYAEQLGEGPIPAHSHLMSAWVQAGIFGAIFWAYILWLTIKAFLRVGILRPPLAPIYTYILVTLMWDIMFSPFGNTRRAIDALVIVIILDLLESGTQHLVVLKPKYGRVWRRTPLSGRVASYKGM